MGQETLLDFGANRISYELSRINTDLAFLNKSVSGWQKSAEVIDWSRDKAEETVQNNTALLATTNATTNADVIDTKLTALRSKMVAYNANKTLFEKALYGGNKNKTSNASASKASSNASASKEAPSADTSQLQNLLPRVIKVEQNYLLNGTKIARLLRSVSRLEGELSLNSTEYGEMILRRQTDDALAEIPREMQNQLVATMKNVSAGM